MLKNLAKKLTNNLGLKVLAVLFAIALWIVVVNIDDPVKPAQYTISVTQDNMDYLTSNGKYSETLGGKNTVTFTASAKRSILEKLSNTDFTAVADMEKIDTKMCTVQFTFKQQQEHGSGKRQRPLSVGDLPTA